MKFSTKTTKQNIHIGSTSQPNNNAASEHRIDKHVEEDSPKLCFTTKAIPANRLTFRVLVSHDIKADVKNILKIAQKIGIKNSKCSDKVIQGIFLTGSLASTGGGVDPSLQNIANGEGQATTVITRFEQIKNRVFYIPGEYDPVSLFAFSSNKNTAPPHLTLRSVNIHNNFVELREGIILAGVGGCLSSSNNDTNIVSNSSSSSSSSKSVIPSSANQCLELIKNATNWYKESKRHLLNKGDCQDKVEESSNEEKVRHNNSQEDKKPQIVLMTNSFSNEILSSCSESSILAYFYGKDDKSSDAVITNVNPGNVPLVGIPSLDKLGEYCIVDFSRSSVYDQWILESVEVNSVYC